MKTRFLTLVLTLLSTVGAWAYSFKVDGICYNFDSSNEVYVTYERYPNYGNNPAYTSLSGDITIPSSVSYNGQDYSVTGIGEEAFYRCSALTSVTIPNSVTSIENNAFYKCSALTSVTIPNSVTSIGSYAFAYCSALTSVTIPNSVTSIGSGAFKSCYALTSVTISNKVTSIESNTFSSCFALTSVTIPNSVTSLKYGVFQSCVSLSSVTIPSSVKSIGKEVFIGCNVLTDVYYAGSVADWCQIEFEAYTSNPLFWNSNFYINNQLVTDLVIPDEVTTIKNYAFYGCSALTSVTIPNSVTSIGISAFYGCSALTSIIIPNNVTSIGRYAFYDCSSLSHIRCEAATPPTLNDDVFGMTSFQLVFVPTGTATAYANAWGNNYTYIDSETEVTVHVETAGQLAAAIVAQGATPARVTKLTVTGTLNDTDFNIMKNNMPLLYSLDLSGTSNTTLPNEAFYKKRTLLSIALPSDLTEILNDAFYNCSLTSITIPNSVTSIGSDAFSNCFALKNVYYDGSEADWCQIDFPDISSNPLSNGACLHINNQLVTNLVIPNEVTTIKNHAFNGCSSLTSVTIPNSVTNIGYDAFYRCSSLTSITIPNSVTSIGSGAFSSCYALTSVTIPNSVTSIGESAFYRCSALTSVTIPNSNKYR